MSAPSRDSDFAKMNVLYFSNEFPYDDLQDICRKLLQHSKSTSHFMLSRFLDEATRAIREEVRDLPSQLKSLVPPYETVLNLVDCSELRTGPLRGSIDGVLLCAVELGMLIGYYERNPEAYPTDASGGTSLTGLGLGLLATAAVSLAPVPADLPLSGALVVRQAFRLGVLVNEVSENLEPQRSLADNGTPGSWAYVLPDVAADVVQKELNHFHDQEQVPDTSKVFISAVSATSVTVSGPPSRLKAMFRRADFFRDCKFVLLPVYGGLCHAEHIYSEKDVWQVVRTPSMDYVESHLSPRIPVYSTSTGTPFLVSSATDLMEQIVSEILTQKIQWDNVIQGVVKKAKEVDTVQCQILVFRPSLPVSDLSTTLTSISELSVSIEELVPWVHEKTRLQGQPRGHRQSKIAIVGMSCRMPGGATDTDKFWDLLETGLDVHKRIPADRFDVDSHWDPAGKRVNTSHTQYGCFIEEPGLFDAPFFNMSPREAQQTDPMQRLAIVTAYEALERAGYVANRTASTNLHRIGTFYGQASDDYREVNTAQEISTYFIPGGCRAFGPGRINYFFKFSGPSYSIDTACSSSLATIQVACNSLWNGDTDMAVAGGMNILTNSDAFAGLSHGHFLSKTANACKTWDCEADGYCRADGIGSVVMKRLEDAEADNDNILGVILAAATNHSADAISITHPHAGHQSYLSRLVMSQAGISPHDVSYVEMHGTGTQAGDAEEIKSVSSVFAPASKRRTAENPLYIGAVKANVGHGEAVAGVTALIKVLLMMQKNAIPAHIGIKNSLNPNFPKDLDRRNLRIPIEKTEWLSSLGKKRVAVVNNFSAAGGNTTVALEDAPLRTRSGVDPRSNHVVAISAKSKISLKGNIERLLAYLGQHTDAALADLSYTTTARRYHHNHRIAVSTTSIGQLQKQLTATLGRLDSLKPIPNTDTPPVTFTFTGQGAAHNSYNLELFHGSPYFRAQILYLDSLVRGQGFPSFLPVLDGSHHDYKHSPVVTQLALLCTEIALAKYWGSLGVRPDVVIGHSLGEYAALHIAGVLSASDAIFLVGQRAVMLQQNCQPGSHRMLAVLASVSQIQKSLGTTEFEIACINSPRETVLTGPKEDMDAIADALRAADIKCTALDVDFAFHSRQTDPVLDAFEAVAKRGVLFQTPQIPIISPLLGKVIFDDKTITANYLRRATRETVDFVSALDAALKIGTIDDETIWVEIGPHPVCIKFVKSTLSSANIGVASLRRDEDSWTTMSQGLASLHCAGIKVDWNEFHRPFETALRLLDLPTYAWNDKTYWIQYNGDWALTKGNTFYDAEKRLMKPQDGQLTPVHSSLSTSTVQQIIHESFNGTAGTVVMQSDLSKPDFYAAAWGHKMNDCGVVTSSIHADIAYTLGSYLHKKLRGDARPVHMDIADLNVLKGLVANKNSHHAQLIQVEITTANIESAVAELQWYNVDASGAREPFASATLVYGDASGWLASWLPLHHFVESRIHDLERLAESGIANRFSHNMAYQLFANSLVDYATKYRGMQSVVLHGLEAFADVVLTTDKSGIWTVPPYFIDSVAHLAGFVMNVSDANDTKTNFSVTPGWQSMRFAKPLTAGERYRSYVNMIPDVADPTVFHGDVYILHDRVIMGVVRGIQFRRYPRILLSRFFSAPDVTKALTAPAKPAERPRILSEEKDKKSATIPSQTAERNTAADIPETVQRINTQVTAKAIANLESAVRTTETTARPLASMTIDGGQELTTAMKALQIIAKESAIELAELTDDAGFGNLGIDSLMSLVIAEKFREELGVIVSGSLFLEYPTIGDLRAWLEEYYS
ncbi:hypothetical protein SUNI508_08444 [Seiridium unicorne]|uniref:Polyketide synthase n=1 Tax=Seiridium unicorne TaxID=138068 RepID=A0ABR2UTN4_9PEZI